MASFGSFDFVELRDGRTGRIGPIFFHPGGMPHPPAGTGRWPRVHSMVVWTEEATKAESHTVYEKVWGKPRRGGNRKLGKGVAVTPHDIARVFPKILPVRFPNDRPRLKP